MFVEQQKGQKINETRPVAVTVTWSETERPNSAISELALKWMSSPDVNVVPLKTKMSMLSSTYMWTKHNYVGDSWKYKY